MGFSLLFRNREVAIPCQKTLVSNPLSENWTRLEWASTVTTSSPAAQSLRIHPRQHPRKRNHFAQVLNARYPRQRALQAQPETRVRHAAVFAQV